MCYEGNTVERSRNHCCNGNVTLRSLCTGEPHVTANKTKIPSFDILLTVHLNIFTVILTNLMH